jgi:hypothetical protein
MTQICELATYHAVAQTRKTMITTRLRFAAGVCGLSTVLLVGGAGGAIASADTGGDGPGGSDRSSSAASESGVKAAKRPGRTAVGSLRKSLRKTIQDATGNLKSDRGPGLLLSTIFDLNTPVPPAPAGQDSGSDTKPSDSPQAAEPADTPAVTSAVAAQTNSPAETPAAEMAVADTSPPPAVPADTPAVDTASVTTQADAVSPAPGPVTSDASTVTPAAHRQWPEPEWLPTIEVLLAPTATVASSAVDVVRSIGEAAISTPALLASLPTSVTPVRDVLGAYGDLLHAVGESAAPLRDLPGELVAVMALTDRYPYTVTAIRDDRIRLAATSQALGTSPWHRLPGAANSGQAVPTSGLISGSRMLGAIAVVPLAPPSDTAPVPAIDTPDAHKNESLLESLFDRPVIEMLVPVSLWALTAAALPGLGGLIIITAAGVRIGYRQAKAGFALHASGIAHFAGPGPLGIVRSGSFVELSPRTLRAVGPGIVINAEVLRPALLLESAA